MKNKDFTTNMLDEIGNKIDVIILMGLLSATFTFITMFFGNFSILFKYFNIGTILCTALIYTFRKKIDPEKKVLLVVLIPMVISVISFVDGGFAASPILLLLISNLAAVAFLNKKWSIGISILSAITLAGIWIWSSQYAIDSIFNIGFNKWSMKYMAFILYIVILYISLYLIKKFLQESISKIEENMDKMFELAYYDKLTNLPNRHLFQKEFNRKLKNDKKGYLLFVSIKNLNIINSMYSEEIGDRSLIAIGDIFKNTIEESGLVARVSGNEFAIFMSEDKDFETYLEESRYRFHNRYHSINTPIKMKFYIGIIHCNDSSILSTIYMHNVNIALTYAKENGAEKAVIYDESLEERIRFDEKLKEHLESAIMLKNIVLHYQAQVDGITKKVVGVEALARWKSDELGNISPYIFIPIVEKLNLAVTFGEHIVDRALSEYKLLCDKYNDDISISINISPSHLLSENFSSFIKGIVDKYNVPKNKVILEITEDIFVDKINDILDELKKIGVKIALDDFGSGYSSLNYLSHLNVDELKIDKSFIDQMNNDKKVNMILEFLVNLSEKYGINIVAEGVETKKQFDELMNMGFVNIQGFYFHRPEQLGNSK